MSGLLIFLTALRHCFLTACVAFFNLGRLLVLVVRPRAALAAENLFLRKQLALFQERQVKPHRAHDATRWLMATVSRLFDWRVALVVVKPDTLIRWHRKGFRLFWRWKSKATGRPPLPQGPPTIDPQDGRCESDLGRGTHRQRIESETGDPGVAPHRGEVPAARRFLREHPIRSSVG